MKCADCKAPIKEGKEIVIFTNGKIAHSGLCSISMKERAWNVGRELKEARRERFSAVRSDHTVP